MRISIIDENHEFRLQIKKDILKIFSNSYPDINICEYSSVSQYLLSYKNQDDLIISEMFFSDQSTGLQILDELAKNESHTILIFLTNHSKVDTKAFSPNVWNYVLKNEYSLLFYPALIRVVNYFKQREWVSIPNYQQTLTLRCKDISVVCLENRKPILYCIGGRKIQLSCRSLSTLERQLAQNKIIRVNDHTLINLYNIQVVDGNQIWIKDYTDPIIVSRSKSKSFNILFQQHQKECKAIIYKH